MTVVLYHCRTLCFSSFAFRVLDLCAAPIWVLDQQYTGRSVAEKLQDMRQAMAQASCSALVLSALDDVAWLFNLRGADINFNPGIANKGKTSLSAKDVD